MVLDFLNRCSEGYLSTSTRPAKRILAIKQKGRPGTTLAGSQNLLGGYMGTMRGDASAQQGVLDTISNLQLEQ